MRDQALGEDALPIAVQDVDGLAALDARAPVAMGKDSNSVDERPERSGSVDPTLEEGAYLDQCLAQVLVVELAIVVKTPDDDAGVAPDGPVSYTHLTLPTKRIV